MSSRIDSFGLRGVFLQTAILMALPTPELVKLKLEVSGAWLWLNLA